MIEPTGLCPLCGHDFGSDENDVACPNCGIGLHRFVPIVRLSRSWFWELTKDATKKLHDLWVADHEEKKWLPCPKCNKGALFITYNECTKYPLTLVTPEDDYCEVDDRHQEVIESDMLHIRCSSCGHLWHDLTELEV